MEAGRGYSLIKVLALVALVAGGVSACQGKNGTTTGEWTGFLEGPKVDVATEVAGRLALMLVDEGDEVKEGQPLAVIEDDLIRARMENADASVEAAKAQLALVQAGTRPDEIRVAEAKLAQARAVLAAAEQSLKDAQAIRANPQLLLIQRTAAETRANVAGYQLEAAVAQAQAADSQNQFWEELVRQLWGGVDITVPGGKNLHFGAPSGKVAFAQEEWSKAGNAAWQAWTGVTQAKANAESAQTARKDAANQVSDAIGLDARVNQALAARDRAAANVLAAEAATMVLKEGASAAQLRSAQSAVDQAKAARTGLQQELTKYKINAPREGTVSRVFYRTGETVGQTSPVVRLNVGGSLTLRVFVPFSSLEGLTVGQAVTVRADGTNRRKFAGSVNRIAPSAEFAGRQPQTDSERNAQLVAVEIAVAPPDGFLKPGMPATLSIGGLP